MATAPHRLVIIGGGVAGLEVATSLGRHYRRRGTVTVTLLDADTAHVWKPMLHQIAAGTRDISQQQTPYLAQAAGAGFAYETGELAGLDRTAREIAVARVTARDGREVFPARRLSYDTLVLTLGSMANDFGTPGVAEHCLSIDSRLLADAFNQEARVRLMQAMARMEKLTIGIVGGGATGVELAAELIALVETVSAYGDGTLKTLVSVTLIEAGPRLLPAFPEDISGSVRTRLEELGIRVLTDTKVAGADAGGFTLADGSRVEASLKVWAAGIRAPAVLRNLDGLETNRSDQLLVTPELRTTRDPAIFAIGDCASCTLPGEARPLPATAQVAHQQAQYLIRNLPRVIAGKPDMPAFRYRNFGALVSLGDYDAFGSLGQFGLLRDARIHGRLAQLSHVLLYRSHQQRLHGFWRGSLLWLVDLLNERVRPPVRLD